MTPGVTFTEEGPAVPVCPVCMEHDRVTVEPAPRHNPDARYLCARCVLSFTGAAAEQVAQRAWEAERRLESPRFQSKAEQVKAARSALNPEPQGNPT